MSSIITSIKDLLTSIFELIYSTISTAVSTVFHLITGILDTFLSFFRGIFDLGVGVGKFTLGHAVTLLLVALAFFGFLQYQRSQGRTVKVGDKKLN